MTTTVPMSRAVPGAEPGQRARRAAKRRAVALAVAIMAGLLAIALWYSASTLVSSGSPVDPTERIEDRVWDTRRLAGAIVAFDIAIVALVLALVRHRRGAPAGVGEGSAGGPESDGEPASDVA